MNIIKCWPTQWLDEAVNSGLAIRKGDHVEFENAETAGMLGQFAEKIVYQATKAEREACAKVCEDRADPAQGFNALHRAANAIRARGEK